MSRFALRFPYFVIVLCLITCVVGVTSVVRMPVDLFPPISIPVVVVATFFSGMPPGADRDRHHRSLRALLHAGQRHRSHRIALAAGREPDQDLLPARLRRGLRRDQHRQSRHGGPAQTAAGNPAAGGAEVRRLEPAGLPGHAQRRGAERGAAARSWAIRRAQPDRQRSRGLRAAALRRALPPDHGVCRSAQAGGAPTERHGRGAHGQRSQSDPARRAM